MSKRHMKLIVGLGNPGQEYAHTRHNAGFEAVEALAASLDLPWQEQKKCQALIAKGTIDGIPVLLAKPTTFMNLSGSAVQALLSYYKITTEDLLIVHDEMDLEPGRLAFMANGGNAGHNGIADIHQKLGSKNIARLRLGIGRPLIGSKEDWVLGKPQAEDKQALETTIEQSVQAMILWIVRGLTAAMNEWNAKSVSPER